MAETYAAQLTRLQAAIASVESNGQSVSIQGVTYTKANLQALYDREAALLRRINQAANGGIQTTVAEF